MFSSYSFKLKFFFVWFKVKKILKFEKISSFNVIKYSISVYEELLVEFKQNLLKIIIIVSHKNICKNFSETKFVKDDFIKTKFNKKLKK